MISRTGRGNFLVVHYEWVAAAVGALALAGAGFYCLFGGNVEEEIAEATAAIESGRSARATVADEDMGPYAAATNLAKALARSSFVRSKAGLAAAELEVKSDDLTEAEKKSLEERKGVGSFFASGRRLLCANGNCGRVTPERLDARRNHVCAFCGFTQEVAKAEVVLDRDGDGLPDEWERRYGLDLKNPGDAAADRDGDDFTNLEEFQAKTDPTDRNSHPDYLDSLKVRLPLKETSLPFVFTRATKIPSGWRCEFFHAREKDDYGRLGRTVSAVIGEEIGKSGFVLKSYEPKETKVAIKGGAGLKKVVDVSEATVERKRDGKKLRLVLAASKKAKPAAVDVQAVLAYERGEPRDFEVVPGAEIVLSGTKYKVVEIKADGKGASVTLENLSSGKKRTIHAE